MNALFTYRFNRISAYFAFWSFVLSTILFLLYTATEAELLIGLGSTLLVMYVVFSPIVLTVLTVNALVNYKDLQQHVIAIFMVLVSISLLILYSTLLSDF